MDNLKSEHVTKTFKLNELVSWKKSGGLPVGIYAERSEFTFWLQLCNFVNFLSSRSELELGDMDEHCYKVIGEHKGLSIRYVRWA